MPSKLPGNNDRANRLCRIEDSYVSSEVMKEDSTSFNLKDIVIVSTKKKGVLLPFMVATEFFDELFRLDVHLTS